MKLENGAVPSMLVPPCRFLAAMLIPSILIFAFVGDVRAQRIGGVVLEDASRKPVENARVALLDASGAARTGIFTDSTGAFTFAVPVGRFSVTVQRLGYEAYTSPPLTLGAGETIALEIRLGVGAVPLEPLVVTVRGRPLPGRSEEFHQRRTDPARAAGHFLTRDDIELSPTARTSDILRRVPNIVLVRAVPAGVDPLNAPEHYIVRLRGGAAAGSDGTCGPAIYMDGVRIRQSENATVDWLVDPSQLEGVEIYGRASTAPAQFASGTDCGVVLFWTRAAEQGGDWSWKRLTVGFTGLALLFGLVAFR